LGAGAVLDLLLVFAGVLANAAEAGLLAASGFFAGAAGILDAVFAGAGVTAFATGFTAGLAADLAAVFTAVLRAAAVAAAPLAGALVGAGVFFHSGLGF
jgi:hypothetical protein